MLFQTLRTGRVKLTLEAVRRLQPFDGRVDGKLALRFRNESNHDFAHQSEGTSERKMPWGPFVGNHITQMIIQYVDDLIVRDGIILRPSCVASVSSASQFHSLPVKGRTKDICRRNLVVEIPSEVSRFRAGPRTLLDIFPTCQHSAIEMTKNH